MNVQKIANELIEQMKSKMKGNLYHWTQVNFSYNSNKMEGSRLTEDQTEMIFETNSFIAKKEESIKIDDLIEASNHFRLFDFMLKHYDDPLTMQMIIDMNVILKRGTSDELNPRYNVGGFKTVPNIIGLINVIKTTPPERVSEELNELLEEYNELDQVELEDIIEFHVRFERIHPFGDGNGRVGRIIMFKECLKNNICPFIIRDQNKNFYIRGLREYDRDRAYLRDTCLLEQDVYKEIANYLLGIEQAHDEMSLG